MSNKNENKEKITIRRLIGNVTYMVRYAAKYDRPLIIRIIILNVLLLSGMAVNDTFILKMIINGLTGKAQFEDIVVILLISLVLVMCLEWIHQLLNEWAKAKLIPLSGRIQRDLIKRNSLKDLIYYDDPENYDLDGFPEKLRETINPIIVDIQKLIDSVSIINITVTFRKS